eukprot:gene44962-55963_t
MSLSTITALSPLDGRYAPKLAALRPIMSEHGYMHRRVQVEVAWFIALSDAGFAEFKPLTTGARAYLLGLIKNFSEADSAAIKEIEKTTNHDVKAVEYWIKSKFEARPELEKASEFVHFACTSEDINNTSHALQLRSGRDQVVLPGLDRLKASGNSLFVVEHALDVIRHADWIVDVGPLAGEHGGQVLYSGPPPGLEQVAQSRTAHYLFGKAARRDRPLRQAAGWLKLRGVVRNNLHKLDADFPLAVLTSVSGVSGSGKSSLVSQALVQLVAAQLGQEPASGEEADDPLADGGPGMRHAAGDAGGRVLDGRIAGGAAVLVALTDAEVLNTLL